MAGKKNKSSKIESLFGNSIFIDELKRIENRPDEEWDLLATELRKKWELTWKYHPTIMNYLETGEVNYDLGDDDLKIIDYGAKKLLPSDSPADEFRILESLHSVGIERGVYIRLPRETEKSDIKEFVEDNWELISNSLESNYPGRLTTQYPELNNKTKPLMYRMHLDGATNKEIAEKYTRGDQRTVRATIKEYTDKILP